MFISKAPGWLICCKIKETKNMGILIFALGFAALIGMVIGMVKQDKRIKQITLRLLILDLILYTVNYVLYR